MSQEPDLPACLQDTVTAEIPRIDYRELLAGDQSSARAVYDAARTHGFFYLTGHGVDSSAMFRLASNVFDLPFEEKSKYDMGTTGHYFGYKRSGAMVVDAKGTPDHSQFYNISKNDMLGIGQATSLEHPRPINDSCDQIRNFMKSCHEIVDKILSVLSVQLGLGVDQLPRMHQISRPSACQTRLTHVPPLKSGVISVGEHTDFGSVTVLFNKLGGLQVLNPDSKDWRFVEPLPGAAIINLGDAIVKLTGGRLFSGLHRVVGPPGKQANCERHSVVYFCRPNSDVRLRSVFPEDEEGDEDALYSDDWVMQRAKSLAVANYKKAESKKYFRGTAHNALASPNEVMRASSVV